MKDKTRSALETAGAAAAVVGSAIAFVSPPAGALVVGAGKGAAGLAKINQWVAGRRRAELKEMLELAMEESVADEAFDAWVEAKAAGDEVFQETVYTTARAFADRASVDVLPAIASLLRSHHREGRAPSRFYRNCLAFLCELEAEEFATVQKLFTILDDALASAPTFSGEVEVRAQPQRETYRFEVSNGPPGGFGKILPNGPWTDLNLHQVLKSLAAHDLGRGQNLDIVSDPGMVGFVKAEIVRLRQIVAPKTRT